MLEVFHLLQTLRRLGPRLVRAAEILASLFWEHMISIFLFDYHILIIYPATKRLQARPSHRLESSIDYIVFPDPPRNSGQSSAAPDRSRYSSPCP